MLDHRLFFIIKYSNHDIKFFFLFVNIKLCEIEIEKKKKQDEAIISKETYIFHNFIIKCTLEWCIKFLLWLQSQ